VSAGFWRNFAGSVLDCGGTTVVSMPEVRKYPSVPLLKWFACTTVALFGGAFAASAISFTLKS